MLSAKEVIEKLALTPLEGEGGYFRQTFKDEVLVSFKNSEQQTELRSASTAIYYLITQQQFSALHRLPQTEVFHFYLGSPIEMVQINSEGKLRRLVLGQNIEQNQSLQTVVEKNIWQGTRLLPGGEWALIGATVSPGFEFKDMELASRSVLISLYPSLKETIIEFTRA